MIVKSIAVGDIFLNVNGNRLTILEIECGLDEDEGRWETSIKYELCITGTGDQIPITEKARAVVQSLSTDDFYSQVHASGNVTQSSTIKPVGNSVLQNDFIANAGRYGMDASDLGRTLMLGGADRTKYQIVGAQLSKGAKPLSRPIVVEGPSGGLKRITVDQAKEGLDLYTRRKVTAQMK